MTEDIERLEREFAATSAKLRQGLPMRAGGLQAESQYADAYSKLVRAGVRIRLRRKYQRG